MTTIENLHKPVLISVKSTVSKGLYEDYRQLTSLDEALQVHEQ